MNRPVNNRLPAGMLDDHIEFFTHVTTSYVFQSSQLTELTAADPEIHQVLLDDLHSRPTAVWAAKDMGLNTDIEKLLSYTRCVFGGYDGKPDMVNGKLVHTEYWDCGSRGDCKYEGKWCCSLTIGDNRITKREIELCIWICTGLPDKQIAFKMQITEGTLNKMKRILCEKIGGSTKLDIMNFSILHNIYNPYDHS